MSQWCGLAVAFQSVMTPDGRFVVFASVASNLVTNDTNGSRPDVFVRDLVTRTTTLVSVNLAGTGSSTGDSFHTAISEHGRFVAFHSTANDLVANDSNGDVFDIFVRDLWWGRTMLVSTNLAGTGGGNGASSTPSLGAGGHVVAFQSDASDLLANDGNSATDVFARSLN